MKKILLLVLVLSCALLSYPQLQNANWCFGTNARLNFNTTPPTSTTSSIGISQVGGTRATASVSDDAGNLLFYTNGNTVWGKNNSVMPSGTQLFGDIGPQNNVVIVPKPNNSDIYYIFTSNSYYGGPLSASGRYGIYYSVVDMNLNNGNGNIVSGLKNIPLKNHNGDLIDHNFYTGTGIKMEAVRMTTALNNDQTKIWATFFVRYTENSVLKRYVYSFLVSDAGINGAADGVSPTPNMATLLNNNNYSGPLNDWFGDLKISPNGAMLCDASSGAVNLYNFNNQNGGVNFYQQIYLGVTGISNAGYGAEFSPNSQFIYFSVYNNAIIQGKMPEEAGKGLNAYILIYQRDLQVETDVNTIIGRFQTPDTIQSTGSLTSIPAYHPYGLQRAVDDKIYVCVDDILSTYTYKWLGTIQQPNLPYPACNFNQFEVNLAPGSNHWGGLPQWVHKAQTSSGPWVWMKGPNTFNQTGIYGTAGVPSSLNNPGSRIFSMSWTDPSGNFWLFGGRDANGSLPENFYSDLWRFNPGTNQWTWMKGSNIVNQPAVYGIKEVASQSNEPGARRSAVTWADQSGNLWMLGGIQFTASGPTKLLNDLWKYNIASNQWTWMKGESLPDHHGFYGTQGFPSPFNTPGARFGAISWTDNSNNLWLLGGEGYCENINARPLTDLWKYNIATNQWTWIKGDKTGLVYLGTYGTAGVPNPANNPGGRISSSGWVDNMGNLWLFGGIGHGSSSFGHLGDLWKYEITTNQWIWMKGDNNPDQVGVYGSLGIPGSGNKPGTRQSCATWTDQSGNLLLFGGIGYASNPYLVVLNDLWKYDVSSNAWSWVDGSNVGNTAPVWGVQGVGSPTTNPGMRWSSAFWKSSNGNIWLFGGATIGGLGSDLWKYTGNCQAPACKTQIINREKQEAVDFPNGFQNWGGVPESIKSVVPIQQIKTIEVFNSVGQLTKRITNSTQFYEAIRGNRIQGIGPGLYFIRIVKLDKTVQTIKKYLQ